MHSFEELLVRFTEDFSHRRFPETPASLYTPAEYFLGLGGKRIRPVLCLMGNELFGEISKDAFHLAAAVELFHNFTLIHDDIMDRAPQRRGMPTVHTKYGEPTAILSGDVTLVAAYEALGKVDPQYLSTLLNSFNTTAREVCEGQQLDMDFEQRADVSMDEYLEMITLKTSVLLASALKMGAVLGGAGKGNQHHLYEFGKNLGIAFQIQDDYLDAFGDSVKVGKQKGGDIAANKKTFLLIRAMEFAPTELKNLMTENPENKIEKVLELFTSTGADRWAVSLKEKYMKQAMDHLEEIAVVSARKTPLQNLSKYLLEREY